jgi:hypothetical protein
MEMLGIKYQFFTCISFADVVPAGILIAVHAIKSETRSDTSTIYFGVYAWAHVFFAIIAFLFPDSKNYLNNMLSYGYESSLATISHIGCMGSQHH